LRHGISSTCAGQLQQSVLDADYGHLEATSLSMPVVDFGIIHLQQDIRKVV